MVEYQFKAAVSGACVVVQRPGQYWNGTTKAWEAIPADGVPAAAHRVAATRFSPKGPASKFWAVSLPIEPADVDGMGASLVVYSVGAGSTLGIDLAWQSLEVPKMDAGVEGRIVFRDVVIPSLTATLAKG